MLQSCASNKDDFLRRITYEPEWCKTVCSIAFDITNGFTQPNTYIDFTSTKWNEYWDIDDDFAKNMNPYNFENEKTQLMKTILKVYNLENLASKMKAIRMFSSYKKNIFMGYNYAKFIFIGLTFKPEYIDEFVIEMAGELNMYSESQQNILNFIYKSALQNRV